MLGRHQVSLLPSDSDSDQDDEDFIDNRQLQRSGAPSMGLETMLLAEHEQDATIASPCQYSGDESAIVVKEESPAAKPRRRRIVTFSSSSEEEDEKENNCSFDLGKIKKQFSQTPKNRHHQRRHEPEQDDRNEYDLLDSFIDDESSESNDESSETDDDLVDKFVTSSEEEEEAVPEVDEDGEHSFIVPDDVSPEPVVRRSNKKTIDPPKTPSAFVTTTKTFLASLSLDSSEDWQCHPDAKRFLKSFSRHKTELTALLFKLFNEEIFDKCLNSDMKVTWCPRLRKTAGFCYYKTDKFDKTKKWCEIKLATKVLTSPDRLRDTLIHEMCHAACWLISGCNGGHGPLFKNWGKRAVTIFPELPLITRCHNYQIESKFGYRCQRCGMTYQRHSKSLDTKRFSCGSKKTGVSCNGKLVLHKLDKKLGKYVPVDGGQADQGCDKENQEGQAPTRTPNAFAAFVKENYKHHRTPGRTHGDTMKQLSKLFAETKLDHS